MPKNLINADLPWQHGSLNYMCLVFRKFIGQEKKVGAVMFKLRKGKGRKGGRKKEKEEERKKEANRRKKETRRIERERNNEKRKKE